MKIVRTVSYQVTDLTEEQRTIIYLGLCHVMDLVREGRTGYSSEAVTELINAFSDRP